MLLGENGTGKSTILQSVALALMGDARPHHALRLDAGDYLSYPRSAARVNRVSTFTAETEQTP